MRFRTRLYVNLDILSNNYQRLKQLVPGSETLFMVKADGYGHGMVPLVNFSHNELGIKEFGVATMGEAKSLREELPGQKFEIYVFSDIQFQIESSKELLLNQRILPVISNYRDLEYVLNEKEFKYLPLILKFNTGMNRLGLSSSKLEDIINLIKSKGRKSIYHLMTHFSSASLSVQNNQNQRQVSAFHHIKSEFEKSGLNIERSSMANSGAIEQNFALDETHIRPGLMLYGPKSLIPKLREESHWDGQIVSRLETYIISIFEVKKGDPIGYGATVCPYDGVVAIIALGYGDGFSTRFQGAEIEYRGHIGKVFGRVNMDMTQVLFKPDALKDLKVGEKFEIWNHSQNKILNFSDQTKTIPYELFCQLTSRVPRVYGLEL
ncbi:MAG: alanine racemase [Bacteriovoracaceae bacterium]